MSFSPDGVQLSLPGGFSLDLMKYWDGQPIYFVCCARAPRDGTGTDQPLGKVFWCVGIEIMKDEENDGLEVIEPTPLQTDTDGVD